MCRKKLAVLCIVSTQCSYAQTPNELYTLIQFMKEEGHFLLQDVPQKKTLQIIELAKKMSGNAIVKKQLDECKNTPPTNATNASEKIKQARCRIAVSNPDSLKTRETPLDKLPDPNAPFELSGFYLLDRATWHLSIKDKALCLEAAKIDPSQKTFTCSR